MFCFGDKCRPNLCLVLRSISLKSYALVCTSTFLFICGSSHFWSCENLAPFCGKEKLNQWESMSKPRFFRIDIFTLTGGSRTSQRRGANPQSVGWILIIEVIFSQNLHENDTNWRISAPPSFDLLMTLVCFSEEQTSQSAHVNQGHLYSSLKMIQKNPTSRMELYSTELKINITTLEDIY